MGGFFPSQGSVKCKSGKSMFITWRRRWSRWRGKIWKEWRQGRPEIKQILERIHFSRNNFLITQTLCGTSKKFWSPSKSLFGSCSVSSRILEQILTRILPVPVWPDISSPAQSFASDMKSPSGKPPSGFWPWGGRWCLWWGWWGWWCQWWW